MSYYRNRMLQRAQWDAAALLPSKQASSKIAPPLTGQSAGSEGLRLARYCALEETVGLLFGAMTLLYIVTSLISLS